MLPVISLIFCGHIGTDELGAVSLAVNVSKIIREFYFKKFFEFFTFFNVVD
jgi:hypothetical protein